MLTRTSVWIVCSRHLLRGRIANGQPRCGGRTTATPASLSKLRGFGHGRATAVRWRSSAAVKSGVKSADSGGEGGGLERGVGRQGLVERRIEEWEHRTGTRDKGERGVEVEGEERGYRGRQGRRLDLWKLREKRFTQHITNLVRKGKVEDAELVFRDMLAAKVRPSTVTFNNIISGLSRAGHAHKAFKYFNDLKKRGLLPTNHTYSSLFKACSEMGPTSQPLLEKIISEIDRRGILLNTIATNSLIVAMTTCGMTDEAFRVYFDLGKHQQWPDVGTFTALLAACSREGERGLERVEQVWREMSVIGVEPDLVCFNTLLQCVKEAGIPRDMQRQDNVAVVIPALNSEKLHSIWENASSQMATDGVTGHVEKTDPLSKKNAPDFRVVSKCQVQLRLFEPKSPPWTVHVFNSGWRWLDSEGVARFLDQLKQRDLEPNIQTLNHLSQMAADWVTMVREVGVACNKVGVARDEVGVAMRHVVPDKRCLVAAVRLQALLGNAKGAEVLRVFGGEAGMALGSAGYQSLAVSCSHRQQGLKLLAKIKEAGDVPDHHTMGTLLGNAATRLDYEYLTALLKEMRHCKMEPNKIMAQILERAANSQFPQSPRMKLRFNGFKGYYTLWKRHYPNLYTIHNTRTHDP